MTDDEHVEQATTFDADDAPGGKRLDDTDWFRQYYNRLSVANTLDFNGHWKDRNRETAKNSSAIVDAIAGQLQLTDYQKEQSQREFSNLPDDFNRAYSTATLALCVCALVANRDGRSYHPNQLRPDSSTENNFSELAAELDLSYSNTYSVWRRVEREIG